MEWVVCGTLMSLRREAGLGRRASENQEEKSSLPRAAMRKCRKWRSQKARVSKEWGFGHRTVECWFPGTAWPEGVAGGDGATSI